MKSPVLCLLCVAFILGADDKKTDKDKIQGSWKILTYELSGEKAPAEAADQLPKLAFAGDKYSVKGGGNDESGTIKLDDSKKPKTIDLNIMEGSDKGKVQLGIYELDGDKLKLCLALPDAKDRPKEFKSTSDPVTILATLEREKK